MFGQSYNKLTYLTFIIVLQAMVVYAGASALGNVKMPGVNELAETLGQEQSMISHNLKPLLQCNFVYIERQGKKRIYSVNNETINALFKVVENHARKFCPTGGKCFIRGS